jgi:glycosyltransferase involved in cell wall biosynthesis
MKPEPSPAIRVLFMIAEYDRISGGQQSLLQLVRRLPAVGVEPLVCFPKEGRCTELFRRAGIPIIVIPGPPLLTNYGQHLLQRTSFSALKIFLMQMVPYSLKVLREMRRRNIAILHCNSVRSLLFASSVPRLFGCKVVWHVRGQLLPFGSMVKKVAETLATSIILVADALKDQIRPQSWPKCRTIHNGIDDQAIPAPAGKASLPFEIGDDRRVVTTVAAVTPFKGYHHLVAAAQLVNEQMRERSPIFLCVGHLFDQAYVDYLRVLVAESRLENFYFLGWQENPFPYYQLADVVVLPTVEREELSIGKQTVQVRSGEGFPRSILEAMFCGKPTVATNVAGTSEQVVAGETGLLVPPGDAKALAQAIISLLEMPAVERESMGARAAARVRAKFSTERMVAETFELYRGLCGRESHHSLLLNGLASTET